MSEPQSEPNPNPKLFTEPTEEPFGEPEGDIKVELLPSEDTILIRAVPPRGVRTPCDVCCVVDVSGSMAAEATVQNASGENESHGLSLLDVVRHACKTVIQTLGSNDRFSLVTYSDEATLELDLLEMNALGKTTATAKVDGMYVKGQTNLWDGLHAGLEVMRKREESGRLGSILLLTDGCPNIHPPRGHQAMLRRYLDANRDLCVPISMYGFGYNLDSSLLKDLALIGDGMYGFIPDAGLVGTVFVNALSNLLCTMAKNVVLSVEVDGYDFDTFGPYETQKSSWGITIHLGTIQFGQSRDVVLRLQRKEDFSGSNSVQATLRYQTAHSNMPVQTEPVQINATRAPVDVNVEVQQRRLELCSLLKDAMAPSTNEGIITTADTSAVYHGILLYGQTERFAEKLREIAESLRPMEHDPLCAAVLQDVTGQVTLATSSTTYWKKWGRHYILSLGHAHMNQQCNNFKDPGVQQYGGELFHTLQDHADAIFNKLPPPKPAVSAAPRGLRGGAYLPQGLSTMQTYNNRMGGCWAGQCMVHLANGLEKAKNIKRGDKLQGGARVVCVVEQTCTSTELCDINGALVTPFHPVKIDGVWEFPVESRPDTLQFRQCESLYDLVLEGGTSCWVNGVECITLGHNITNDDVLAHPYFGSPEVVNDLKRHPGWNQGLVKFRLGTAKRDASGLVSAFF